MTDKEKKDCPAGSCSISEGKNSKLVKSTDLPLTGNPYPPKDLIQDDQPNSLERSIGSARTVIQPYFSPIGSAFSRVSDIASIGVAHSQSAFQNLAENQNAFTSGLIISVSTIFGFLLARKRGFFKKTLYTATFFAGSAALCNQDAAKKYIGIGWVMAKNNLPTLAASQYEKITNQLSALTSSGEKESPKEKK